MTPFAFACPACQTTLQTVSEDERRCPADGLVYRREQGIWRFLTPERTSYLRSVGVERGTLIPDVADPESYKTYYRELPFRDVTGRHGDYWKFRASGFQVALERGISPMEGLRLGPIKVIDLGGGNGWLAGCVARRLHTAAAVQLSTDSFEGLGAHRFYEPPFVAVQAEFVRLPFVGRQMDVVVFNSSLHFVSDRLATLAEACRVLRPDGVIIVMDSPVFTSPQAGGQKFGGVREEGNRGERGTLSTAGDYLIYEEMEKLAAGLKLRWEVAQPRYGAGWRLRSWRTKLFGGEETAQYPVFVGRKLDRRL